MCTLLKGQCVHKFCCVCLSEVASSLFLITRKQDMLLPCSYLTDCAVPVCVLWSFSVKEIRRNCTTSDDLQLLSRMRMDLFKSNYS